MTARARRIAPPRPVFHSRVTSIPCARLESSDAIESTEYYLECTVSPIARLAAPPLPAIDPALAASARIELESAACFGVTESHPEIPPCALGPSVMSRQSRRTCNRRRSIKTDHVIEARSTDLSSVSRRTA